MERLKIGVIDRSPSIRETVAIVLHDHEVDRFSPESFQQLPHSFQGDLLIVERDSMPVESLLRLAPGVPVLWLESDARPVAASSTAALPRFFQPQVLRQRVREFSRMRQWRRVEDACVLPAFSPPLLPASAVPAVRVALQTQLPTLIFGEAGTGKSRLVRALHAQSGNRAFLRVDAAACDVRLLDTLRNLDPGLRLTLYLSGLEHLSPKGSQVVVELLEQAEDTAGRVWLLSCSRYSPDDLVEQDTRFAALLHRVAVLTVRLLPLRERGEELRALVAQEGLRLSAMLHVSPPTFTAEAWERLLHYLWFGNVAELEAVLARTMTLVPQRPIPAAAILFDPPNSTGPGTPASQAGVSATAPTVSDHVPTTRQLEVLLNELAHELKNPLVTIKTISQHLERLLSDEAGREQVVQLAGEAVDRMDQLLDNLLRFAHFGAPAAQTTTVNAVIAPALAELAPMLSERQIVLHYLPPEPTPICADPTQLTFALENLLRAVVRDLDEGTTLSIQPLATGAVLEIRFPRSGTSVSARLGQYTGSPAESATIIEPLGFLIARSLLGRNRATLEERVERDMRFVTIRFTSVPGTEISYAEATRSHRG